ncbi:DUF1403 family protein [Cohaesibacter haloalkalitolerans]|uniref:DUF1403 family protein n=1 Tax=Cohaesibacter haloalkalitolerans TaxID=1162980 RepID=UPI000E654419|nr:DUF1403 family protein [Cohaesibacter haloalkalitolerans]
MTFPLSQPPIIPGEIPAIPHWGRMDETHLSLSDAAFSAGIALTSLDNLVKSEPIWAGCWRARQALTCAVVTSQMMGRRQEAAALRDMLLLTAPGDDPGPAGRIATGYRNWTKSNGTVNTKTLRRLADAFGVPWDDALARFVTLFDDALQVRKAVPFAVADLLASAMALRPDAECLAWLLGDWLIASRLGWHSPVPLLVTERYAKAFRLPADSRRVQPGETAFQRAVCLSLIHAADHALQSARPIARRADCLVAMAPKLRTRGAEPVIKALLDDDALLASAPGFHLSRWASRRLFQRLLDLGAIRELSGRASFKIYGL